MSPALLAAEFRLAVDGVHLRLVLGSPCRRNEYLFAGCDLHTLERIARGVDCEVLSFEHTYLPWVRTIAGVLMVNAGGVGKPKDGELHAAWALPTVDADRPVVAELRRSASAL